MPLAILEHALLRLAAEDMLGEARRAVPADVTRRFTRNQRLDGARCRPAVGTRKADHMRSNSKPCRNCGSSEQYAKEVTAGDSAALLPIGALHGPKFQIIVCGSCGLTEWFVPNRFLPLAKEQFDPL